MLHQQRTEPSVWKQLWQLHAFKLGTDAQARALPESGYQLLKKPTGLK